MTDKYRVHEITRFNYSDIGEYIDENHTDRPLRNDILVKLLNDLSDENEQLKKDRAELFIRERDTKNEWRELKQENEQLRHDATILIQANQDYRKENEQLQERNDRQAKQLDRLYQLISEKDWRTLTDIMDDFKKAEEQLQREWQTYW